MSIDKVGGSSVIAMMNSEAALATQLGGDTNAQVAAMMLKHGHDKRAATREMRHTQEDQLKEFEAEKVAQLREQAAQVLAAGRREAFGKIAGGALNCAGGIVGASSGRTGAKITSHSLTGAGSGAEGGMKLWALEAEKAGSEAGIAATEAEHKAEEAKRRMDDLKDDEQGAREIIRNAFDFLKGAAEKQAEIQRAALFNRV